MGYGVMVELFQKSETDGFIRQHNNKLNLEIKNLSDNDVLYGDFEKWVSYFFAKYKIQPITLYMDKITNSMSKTKVKEYHPLRERYYDIDGDLIPKNFVNRNVSHNMIKYRK